MKKFYTTRDDEKYLAKRKKVYEKFGFDGESATSEKRLIIGRGIAHSEGRDPISSTASVKLSLIPYLKYNKRLSCKEISTFLNIK